MSWRSRWPLLKQVVVACFLVVAAWLLWRYARVIEWREVMAAIAGYPRSRLVLAAMASMLAYALYCGFDVLARAYTGHALPLRRVLPIAFVCYAFILNLGGLVGGFGFRYRLYSHAGLGMATIWRVAAFAVATNWSGFLLLGGLALAFDPLPLPPAWDVATRALRLGGFAMLAAVATGLALCAFSRRRSWSLRGHVIELPSLPIALLQLALASASWFAIATILYLLMPDGVRYLTVAGVLLLSVLANLVVRIPANLGVLEAVFIALLGPQLGTAPILAALLTYRALFHLGPLLLALCGYLLLEAHARSGPSPA
jgi:uncharacterized membrane protein YbhN (UPF0104 family)